MLVLLIKFFFIRIQWRQIWDVRRSERQHARPHPEERQPEPLPHRDGQVCRILWKAKVNIFTNATKTSWKAKENNFTNANKTSCLESNLWYTVKQTGLLQ